MSSFSYKRDLIWQLARREFGLKYKGSSLGVLWYLLLPLFYLFVLVFMFRRVIPLNIEAYPAFVLTAIIPWTWFSTCIGSSAGLFISNRDLMRHPNFKPINLIIVNTMTNSLAFLIFLPILFGVLVLYGRPVSAFVVLLPLLIIIQTVLMLGLSLIIATLNVFYRDIQPMVTLALTLLFFMTPIFYGAERLKGDYQLVYTLNPVAPIIQGYRAILFDGRPPEWDHLVLTSVIGIVFSVIGYVFYKNKLHEVFDEI